MLAINGTADHIHLVIGRKPDCSVSDLVREIKKSTNSFIKAKNFCRFNFKWQSGFGAFSYNQSNLSNVIEYVMNQKEHHKRVTFKEEYIELLRQFKIDFKEEYLFEWLE